MYLSKGGRSFSASTGDDGVAHFALEPGDWQVSLGNSAIPKGQPSILRVTDSGIAEITIEFAQAELLIEFRAPIEMLTYADSQESITSWWLVGLDGDAQVENLFDVDADGSTRLLTPGRFIVFNEMALHESEMLEFTIHEGDEGRVIDLPLVRPQQLDAKVEVRLPPSTSGWEDSSVDWLSLAHCSHLAKAGIADAANFWREVSVARVRGDVLEIWGLPSEAEIVLRMSVDNDAEGFTACIKLHPGKASSTLDADWHVPFEESWGYSEYQPYRLFIRNPITGLLTDDYWELPPGELHAELLDTHHHLDVIDRVLATTTITTRPGEPAELPPAFERWRRRE